MQPVQAEKYLVHPLRLYVTGRSKSGKTTETVGIIDKVFRPQVDRMVVCVPCWFTQSLFDPIRDMVKPERDILDYRAKDPFFPLLKALFKQTALAKKAGRKNLNTLLLVDDMVGQSCISNRMSSFSNLAIQAPHLALSIITISQNPKSVVAAFRTNCDAYLCFPPQSIMGRNWLHEELNGNQMSKEGFDKLIDKAWRGKRKDFNEMNQHFLFVVLQNRRQTRYFMDFGIELESRPDNAPQRQWNMDI